MPTQQMDLLTEYCIDKCAQEMQDLFTRILTDLLRRDPEPVDYKALTRDYHNGIYNKFNLSYHNLLLGMIHIRQFQPGYLYYVSIEFTPVIWVKRGQGFGEFHEKAYEIHVPNQPIINDRILTVYRSNLN